MTNIVRTNDIDTLTLGTMLAKSGYFQDAREEAQAVVKVLAGAEMGFGPIASMTGIHIINGKPSVSANLIASAIKRSGKYDYQVSRLDANECVLMFWQRRRNNEFVEIGESVFTLDDAKAAGALTGRNAHTWKAYARNMLFARAISNGARWYCPDIFGGPVYMPEEMGAAVNGEGDIIAGEVVPNEAPRPQIAPASPQPVDRRTKIIARIRQVEGELIALNPAYEPFPDDDLSDLDDQQLLSYGNQLRVWIDDAKQPQVEARTSITEGETRFWASWGGFLGGTEWERVTAELGTVAVPTDDAGWDALSERMDEHAAKTVTE